MVSSRTSCGSSIICVHYHKHSHHDEIYYQKYDGWVETCYIAPCYTFAKKYTMMIVIWNTNVAILTMLHIICHIDITLCTIVKGASISLLINFDYPLRSIIFWLFSCLPLSLLDAISIRFNCTHFNIILYFFIFWALLTISFLCVIQIYWVFDTRVSKNSSEETQQI